MGFFFNRGAEYLFRGHYSSLSATAQISPYSLTSAMILLFKELLVRKGVDRHRLNSSPGSHAR